ncbi:unnamed protein product [Prorocentrum cordatum]|uniref:AB hydrolase-1 domain-containing protein n=1 Tax=Prorocentrum cordatum TaxID=2364126 RepID=A0ABN9RRF7_9DINO|nr:unnamed protein product [Polarella glacialis]
MGVIASLIFWYVKSYFNPGPPTACYALPSKAGYPVISQHNIKTQDGMSLKMWRVPGDCAKPVLIMSGLECSSRDWFAGLDSEALPWLLSREGFDVWLGNNRGVFLSNTPAWNWTFIDMADFDLPAMIDAILAETRASTLRAFVGHSQGAFQGFLKFGEDDTIRRRVDHFVALSPAVFLTQQRYTWRVLSALHLDDLAVHTFLPPGSPFEVMEEMQRDLCWVKSWLFACWDAGGLAPCAPRAQPSSPRSSERGPQTRK